MNILEMTPRRPHLFSAIYDWILENQLTPYIVVNTTYPYVDVPSEFILDDEIVLNINPISVGNYMCNFDGIEFDARFSGKSRHIIVPMGSVKAIYAKENGVGMAFEDEPAYVFDDDFEQFEESNQPSSNPFTIIK